MWPEDVAKIGVHAVAIWSFVAAAGGEVVETVETIAARCGMSERTARRYLRRMAEAGHIVLLTARGRKGHVHIILVDEGTASDAARRKEIKSMSATAQETGSPRPPSDAVSSSPSDGKYDTVSGFGQEKPDTVSYFYEKKPDRESYFPEKQDSLSYFEPKSGHSVIFKPGKYDTVTGFPAKSFKDLGNNKTTGLKANGGFAPIGFGTDPPKSAEPPSSTPTTSPKPKPKRSWRFGSKKLDREAVMTAFSELLNIAPPRTKQLRSQWEYGAHVLLKELGGVDEVKRRLEEFARRRAAGEFQFTVTGPMSVANVLKNINGGSHAQTKKHHKFNPAKAAKSAEWKPRTDAEREWLERVRRGRVSGVRGDEVGT